MKIQLNGQLEDFSDGITLQNVIATLCNNPNVVIAELNGGIIAKGQWSQTRLKENDKIELVSLVGGG